MQARFDGLFGFPGGMIDKSPDEEPVTGLNRELEEEINLDLNKYSLTQVIISFCFLLQKKNLKFP